MVFKGHEATNKKREEKKIKNEFTCAVFFSVDPISHFGRCRHRHRCCRTVKHCSPSRCCEMYECVQTRIERVLCVCVCVFFLSLFTFSSNGKRKKCLGKICIQKHFRRLLIVTCSGMFASMHHMNSIISAKILLDFCVYFFFTHLNSTKCYKETHKEYFFLLAFYNQNHKFGWKKSASSNLLASHSNV